MSLTDLPPTALDLNFSVFRIPVRVHPLFWLVSAVLGGITDSSPTQILVWVGVMFVSILIHELGHAVTIRSFGWWPSILLYTLGGLAIYHPTYRDPRKQMVISLAGPAAGFLLAGLLIAILNLSGNAVRFKFGLPFGIMPVAPVLSNENLTELVQDALYINFWWGLVNLLPVHPLDGGRFVQSLFEYLRVPDGLVKSLWISIIVAAAVAIYGLARMHSIFLVLMFGSLAFNSFQTLQSITGRGGGYGRW
jgi:stage IV sporulation protein FB